MRQDCRLAEDEWHSSLHSCFTLLGFLAQFMSGVPSLWNMHVLDVSVWVFVRGFGFFPHPKDMYLPVGTCFYVYCRRLVPHPEVVLGIAFGACQDGF